MSTTAPKYYTITEIVFPSIAIEGIVKSKFSIADPEIGIGKLKLIDTILMSELRLPKDNKGSCNIRYKLVSLPTIAVSQRWVGPMELDHWRELHDKRVLIEGSFKFTYRGQDKYDETLWHTVNIHPMAVTVMLE